MSNGSSASMPKPSIMVVTFMSSRRNLNAPFFALEFDVVRDANHNNKLMSPSSFSAASLFQRRPRRRREKLY
jgi:hypothetical protein